MESEEDIPQPIPDRLAKIEHFKEFDKSRRQCKVWIFSQPIQNLPIPPIPKIMKKSETKLLRHWFVVCSFGNRLIRYELTNPSGALKGGEIFPNWSEDFGDLRHELDNPTKATINVKTRRARRSNGLDEMTDEEVGRPRGAEGAEIGTIVTSPRKVFELVCNHEMNFKRYQAVSNNCQNWVMKLLETMSPELRKSAEEAKFTTLEDSRLRLPIQSLVMMKTSSHTLKKKN